MKRIRGFVSVFAAAVDKEVAAALIVIWLRLQDGAWSRDAWQVVPPVNAVPCWNPVLFHLPATGETLLFYKVGMNTETWRPFILRSHDNGLTWGSPEVRRAPPLPLIFPPPSQYPLGNASPWRLHLPARQAICVALRSRFPATWKGRRRTSRSCWRMERSSPAQVRRRRYRTCSEATPLPALWWHWPRATSTHSAGRWRHPGLDRARGVQQGRRPHLEQDPGHQVHQAAHHPASALPGARPIPGWAAPCRPGATGGATRGMTSVAAPAQTPNGVKMLIRSKDGVIVRASSEDVGASPRTTPRGQSGIDSRSALPPGPAPRMRA